MADSLRHLNLEALEARTLFAGLDEAVVDASSELQSEVVECEGIVRQFGEAVAVLGSYIETPGSAIQSMGQSVFNYFSEVPEYPSGGVYKGLSVDILSGLGSVVSAVGFVPTIAGSLISYVGMFGEMLGDDGGLYETSLSNAIRGGGEGIAHLGEAITEWGTDFSLSQRYAPEYAVFVDQHQNNPVTIAGEYAGSFIAATGFLLKLPGTMIHETGDAIVTTCDIATSVSEGVSSLYSKASQLYSDYLA